MLISSVLPLALDPIPRLPQQLTGTGTGAGAGAGMVCVMMCVICMRCNYYVLSSLKSSIVLYNVNRFKLDAHYLELENGFGSNIMAYFFIHIALSIISVQISIKWLDLDVTWDLVTILSLVWFVLVQKCFIMSYLDSVRHVLKMVRFGILRQ